MQKIAILGGTGFIGKQLASRLAKAGWWVRVVSRRREDHRELLVLPTAEVVSVDVHSQDALTKAFAGYDVVVNLVGILNESGSDGAGFRAAHVELAQKVVAACKANSVKHLLHMSALNADAEKGASFYLKTKGEAEDLVHQSGLNVTSFRPSVIFGLQDSFFNRFAGLLRLAPIFPVACPNSKFAPVWVDDVVTAMVNTINNAQHFGKRYNLCGPKVYTLQEIVEYTAALLELKRKIMPLSDETSKKQAQFLDRVPGKPFSMDNYHSLQVDSVCECNDLETLGVQPHTVEGIMPRYFAGRSPRAVYHKYRYLARR